MNTRPTFRDKVIMKLIGMGLGEKLSPDEEENVKCDGFDHGVVEWTANDICTARGWNP